MTDIIVIAILLVCIAAALGYIIKAKKRGVRCIGCSSAGTCGGKCSCNIDAAKLSKEIRKNKTQTDKRSHTEQK